LRNTTDVSELFESFCSLSIKNQDLWLRVTRLAARKLTINASLSSLT